MSPTIKTGLLAALLVIGTGRAHATIITFDEFEPSPNDPYPLTNGAVFETEGYNFTVTSGLVWLVNKSGFSHAASNGTTNLDLGGTVNITSASKKPFSVTSIDMATLLALETSTLKFTGTKVNGATTTRSYSMNGTMGTNPYALTTTPLTDFTNITSFGMAIVYNPRPMSTYFSIVDNIVINEVPAGVPEPSTWTILGLGLAMIAGLTRRKFY